jgi:hypothetical protein
MERESFSVSRDGQKTMVSKVEMVLGVANFNRRWKKSDARKESKFLSKKKCYS